MKLSIGKNNYIGGKTMDNLLKKLSMLKNFSELDVTDVTLDMTSLESLCDLLQSSSISALAIGGTEIELCGALKLSGSLATRRTTLTMLDMSFCDVDFHEGSKLCQDLILHGLVQLNLSGNRLEERGANVLRHLLAKSCCHLKILMINKCALGKNGILKIIQALSDNNSLQDLGLAGNITDKNSFFTGADTCSVESCVKRAVNKLNYHVECSDNNADDWPKQHESSTSDECTSFLHCVSGKEYNNRAKDQECQSLCTCLKTNVSETKTCVGDKSENIQEKTLSLICKQHEINCDDYIADGEEVGSSDGVNCSFLNADCASSSQPFGLMMDKSRLLPDLHTHENIVIRGDVNTIKMSYGKYASELFVAIQMAKNLQLLDLSDNSLPLDMAEQLYVSWSLNTRAANPVKHIDKPVVHFSVEGRQCCGERLCCQRWI